MTSTLQSTEAHQGDGDGTDQPGGISKSQLLSVVAAGAPIVGYGAALLFEVGYASHFGIPLGLISVSLEQFAILLVVTITVCLGVFALIQAVYPIFFYLGKPRSMRYFTPLLVISIVTLTLAVGLWPTRVGPIILVVFALPMVLHIYLSPWFHRKKHGGYLESLAAMRGDLIDANMTYFTGFERRNVRVVVVFLIITFLIPLFALASGMAWARNQEVFAVIADDPTWVVVRIYGDLAICARKSPTENRLLSEFKVLKLSGDTGRPIVLKHVGPFGQTHRDA